MFVGKGTSRSEHIMSTARPVYEWKALPWKSIERKTFKLQKRIYQASAQGNGRKVRKLQRLLVSSRSAKLLAVRRITQDNQGKKTAGVDGVKALTPTQRLKLAASLTLTGKAAPVRRVWIPKPGTEEKRGLGIPTMRDRATQTLVKFALEPEWEARFEPNSYGFRPGRSCWDAIEAIYLSIKTNNKWVLDADIAKCFDRINHDALLEKINTGPRFRRQIKAWLQAGVMDGDSLFPSEEGTPQGGAISPLLANIALHGMEQAVQKAYPQRWGKKKRNLPTLVRYADGTPVQA
jgi:RNA-directed DNA polymerase